MIQIKNVLCPIDFFAASERALRYSIGLARNYDATLHVLHVVSPVLPASYEFSVNTADLVETFKKQAEDRMGEVRTDAHNEGIRVETIVRVGDVDAELADAVDQSDADLLVMGTHGRRGFERWFLGSVTERLLRHCAVPILMMSDLDADPAVPPDLKKILVTTDFSEGTSGAMDYAIALAQEAPASLTLLHVVEQPPERKASVEGVASILEEHLDSMVPDSVRDWCEVKAEVVIGTPYQRILAVAHEEHADIIVMNIHGKGMLERALMGTTAERVLRAAECPVLAIPPVKA
jgi:nucleotide-binding universal stress UspA family protein